MLNSIYDGNVAGKTAWVNWCALKDPWDCEPCGDATLYNKMVEGR